jgi:chromosome segregation ATPase
MISQDRLEKALRYLAETDEPVAEAKGEILRLENLIKRVQYRLFLSAQGSVEARKAEAGKSEETARLEEELVSATVRYEGLRAKRDTERSVIEVWRSLESSRRQGA